MADAPYSNNSGERPWSVTLVAWGVILLGMLNGWRAVTVFRQRGFLLDLGVTLDPAVVAGAAGVWALLFLAAAVIIFRRIPAARWLVPVMLLTNALFSLALVAIWGETPESGGSLRLTTFFSITGLGLVIWALNRKAARDYFVAEQE